MSFTVGVGCLAFRVRIFDSLPDGVFLFLIFLELVFGNLSILRSSLSSLEYVTSPTVVYYIVGETARKGTLCKSH